MFVAGVALGTLRDTIPMRETVRVDGFMVLAGDFHVHAFIGDGGIAPWMLQRQATRVGLDVIAITNHNQTLAGRIGRWASRRVDGPIVITGEEVTGRDFHLIAVGIERPVGWNQPAARAIDDVHAQGGVAIAAHPTYAFAEGYDDTALARLDGVEAAHPGRQDPRSEAQFEEFYLHTLALNPGIAAIGSSDVHVSGALGLCRTYLLVRERSEAGVIEAIREGRTVGRDVKGVLHGAPALVRIVEAHRAALAPPQPDGLSRLAPVCVWVALFALAILGPRRSG